MTNRVLKVLPGLPLGAFRLPEGVGLTLRVVKVSPEEAVDIIKEAQAEGRLFHYLRRTDVFRLLGLGDGPNYGLASITGGEDILVVVVRRPAEGRPQALEDFEFFRVWVEDGVAPEDEEAL